MTDADGWMVIDSWFAGPGVIATDDDEMAVIDGALNDSVRPPTCPVMARLENVATPFASVVAVRVPPSVGRPLETDAVTTTPDWLTELPETSWRRTAGCCAKIAPLTADADGCVDIASLVAGPGLIVTAVEVAPVRAV